MKQLLFSRLFTIGFISALGVIIVLLLPSLTKAQEVSSGIAVYVQIPNVEIHDGDLVSYSDKGYTLSAQAYDPTVFGVISFKPSVALENINLPDAYYAISRGKVYTRVTTENGPIKAGDLITTSNTKGVGQKATQNGYLVGTAIGGYTEQDPTKIGTILVNLHFGFNTLNTDIRTNLLENFQTAIKSPFVSPVGALRYIIAGVVIIIAIAFAIWFFGRLSSLGIEALGRNPLASRKITAGIILNLILSFVVITAGIAIAYFILLL